MNEAQKSFVMYRSFLDAAQLLPDHTARWRFIEMISNYALDHIEPENDGSQEYFGFVMAKAPIDYAIDRRKTAIANGCKGGRPTKNPPETEPEANTWELAQRATNACPKIPGYDE